MTPDVQALATIRRDPHRGTRFVVQMDVSNLMDEHGGPLVAGDDLEHLIVEQVTRAIRRTLREAREKVAGHP